MTRDNDKLPVNNAERNWHEYAFAYKIHENEDSEYLYVKARNEKEADMKAAKRLKENKIQPVMLLRLVGYDHSKR